MLKKWIVENRWMSIAFLIIILLDCFFVIPNAGVTSDDAYIFYRYARNLAHHWEFSYNPGETSFGFTSCLWMVFLGLQTAVTRIDPLLIAKFWVVLFHAGSILLFYLAAKKLLNNRTFPALFGAFLFGLDRNVVDNALSGMESAIGMFFYLLIGLAVICRFDRRPLTFGFLVGLGVLTRPEYIAVFPAFVLYDAIRHLNFNRENLKNTVVKWMIIAAGALIVAGPYTFYLRIKTGHFTAYTYKGKILTRNPDYYSKGFGNKIKTGFKANGALIRKLMDDKNMRYWGLILLLSSTVYFVPVWKDLGRQRIHPLVYFYLAYIIHFILFFFKYPTANWRYHMTLMPIMYLGLITGLITVVDGLNLDSRSVIRTGIICTLFVSVWWSWRFWQEYQRYTKAAVMERYLPVAQWVNDNLSEDDYIALDMIGAFGYLTHVKLFDLGGLIDPDMWPCLENRNNGEKLFQLFKRKKVNYLAVYDEHIMWNHLPSIIGNLTPVKKFNLNAKFPRYFRIYQVDFASPYKPGKKANSGPNPGLSRDGRKMFMMPAITTN